MHSGFADDRNERDHPNEIIIRTQMKTYDDGFRNANNELALLAHGAHYMYKGRSSDLWQRNPTLTRCSS